MASLDIDTLNTELKVKTCIFTCRYSSNMGKVNVAHDAMHNNYLYNHTAYYHVLQ